MKYETIQDKIFHRLSVASLVIGCRKVQIRCWNDVESRESVLEMFQDDTLYKLTYLLTD